ncbi:hypothetical protein GBP346_B0188 [Burkholderia pseudomallei MSHR346]|nr:hypothetical protein GBP346_B0188 [Burkholderia pseudomallei MSHR346]
MPARRRFLYSPGDGRTHARIMRCAVGNRAAHVSDAEPMRRHALKGRRPR